MQVLAPDVLEEMRPLSYTVLGSVLFIGLFLWLLGGRNHRFWIVLAATVGAGVVGLRIARNFDLPPMVAALLLAVTAGVLALHVVRLVTFFAVGAGGYFAVSAFAPGGNEALFGAILGGLAGLLFFRFWMKVLTSMLGALLLAYGSLSLADHLKSLDAIAFVDQHRDVLNGVAAGLALLGLLLQMFLDSHLTRVENRGSAGEAADGGPKILKWAKGLVKRRAG